MRMRTLPTLLILLTVSLIVSCEECEECERLAFAPSTTLVFINEGALALVEEGLAIVQNEVDTLDSQLTAISAEIAAIEVDIDTLEQRIGQGETGLEDELAEANEQLASKEMEQATLQLQLDVGNALVDSLETRQDLIETGALVVSEITNLRNGWSVTNSDTLTSYAVPLEVEIDDTAYALEIAGASYDLTISYERTQTLDAERVVRIAASSLSAFSNSFNDLIVLCPETNPNCGSGETLIVCYF